MAIGKAPVAAAVRKKLKADARDIAATARSKGITIDDYELRDETQHARDFFELGCWLFYFSPLIRLEGAEGLRHRIDCAATLFKSGKYHMTNSQFFTVFGFGERDFDSLFEMGDADQVVAGLRAMLDSDVHIRNAFLFHRWPITV